MLQLQPVTTSLAAGAARERLLQDFRDGAVEALFIDVQMDLFDRDRLAIRGTSEAALNNLPPIGQRIGRFSTRITGLKKTWMVHAWNKQLRAISSSTEALRSEIVPTTAPEDDVLPKTAFCPFYKTPLSAKIRQRGSRTVLMAGAVFEWCVKAGYTAAIREEGLNVVLISDLTAAEEGLSGADIENRFEYVGDTPAHKPWFGVLRERDVWEAMANAPRLECTGPLAPLKIA